MYVAWCGCLQASCSVCLPGNALRSAEVAYACACPRNIAFAPRLHPSSSFPAYVFCRCHFVLPRNPPSPQEIMKLNPNVARARNAKLVPISETVKARKYWKRDVGVLPTTNEFQPMLVRAAAHSFSWAKPKPKPGQHPLR